MGKRSTYFAEEIERIIDVAPDGVESFSGRVGFLIGAAQKIASEAAPALPVEVWCALADANNGCLLTYDAGAPWVVSGMSHNLYDSDSTQFGIDGRVWSGIIRDLSFAQQFSIFEVVRKFWTTNDNESQNYTERFAKCGGRVSDVTAIKERIDDLWPRGTNLSSAVQSIEADAVRQGVYFLPGALENELRARADQDPEYFESGRVDDLQKGRPKKFAEDLASTGRTDDIGSC